MLHLASPHPRARGFTFNFSGVKMIFLMSKYFSALLSCTRSFIFKRQSVINFQIKHFHAHSNQLTQSNRFLLKTKESVSTLSFQHFFCLLSSAEILHFSPPKQEKPAHPSLLFFCHLLFIHLFIHPYFCLIG